MLGKFELTRSKDQFMFNLKAANGLVVLTSERYKTKAAAMNGIKSVKTHAKADKNFDRRTAKNGNTYFVLKAVGGQIIGKSQMYKSTSGRLGGIKSVRANAGKAKVVDLT